MLPLSAAERRPLTAIQTSMVLASLREPTGGAYIVQDVCETDEALELSRLQRAWRLVAARHPALRMMIETGPEETLAQRVHAEADVNWTELDWSGRTPGEDPDRLAGWLRADRERGFDFQQGVPMRFTLLRTRDQSILIWTSHHALLDGRSYQIAWSEWFAIYEALDRGEEIRLPEPGSFPEYLDWLNEQDLSAAERYWKEQLRGTSSATGHVPDRIRLPDSPTDDTVAKETVTCSGDLTEHAREFAAQHEITVSTLLQGSWSLLLSRYCGRPETVLGVTRAGRRGSVPRAGNIIGPLINTLPFRITAGPDACVLPWLRQVREQMLAQREYAHTPLRKIQEWGVLPRFDSLFVYEHLRPSDALRKLGGNWRRRTLTRFQRTDVPLTLAGYGEPLLSLDVVYDTRLFCRETVAGMAGHLEALLARMIERPQARLAELSLLTERERREPIDQPTQATTLRVDLCAHQLFERQVQQRPAAIALEHGGEAISYAEVNRRANRLAHLLRERGAGAEDLVGVCLDRSPEAVIAVMAVLKAGAAFVMFGPNLPAGRLAAMLQDASPKLVITTDAHEEKLSGCAVLSLDREWAHIDRQSASNPDCTAALDNAAYAVFTSGSTGRPKAVVVTHRSLANHSLAVSRIYGVSPGDRRVQFGAVGSDIFLSEVFTNLCSGVTLVFCLDRGGNSVAEFLRLIEVHRITLTGLPSSWWAEWAAAMARGDLAIPPSLRLVIVGMEQVNPAALAAFRKAAGDRIRLFNAYGPTETGPTTTIYEAGSSRWEGASLVPIGRPIANTRVYVLDEQQNPVPVGVPGELYIGGDGVARGYLNAPEQTEARFIPDPYDGAQPARRLFRTGDVVFSLPDGNLVFLGRVDRQVKIRGFRVELEEIEAALAEHPDIRQCAVVVRNDQGGERLAAYLTPWSLPGPTPGELRRHLLQRVPDYMLPADFTTLPDMPMTANGKVDRQALPADAPQMQEPERFDVAVTATEKRVAALWQEVLGAAHTSVIANFFESGGDSLRATRLLARIQEEFRRPFPFALFQRGPTITQIAHALDADTPGAPYADTVLARGTQGSRVPLFCITSAADDLYVFRHITSHLDGPQPVFVLNAPIREGEGLRRVEDLAVRVCESIHGIQGSGPYILGGYCFGGILAFEAAQQLLLQGEEVRLVVLFDTPAPGYPRILSSRQRYWDELVSGGVVRTTVREVLAHAKAVGRLLKSRTLANAQNTLVNVGIAAAAVRGKDGVNLVEAAARTYVPKPIDADVAQFIAEDQNVSSRVLEDPRLGWRYLCKRDFRVWRVPGDHITWLREPHARATAELLNRVLGERTEL